MHHKFRYADGARGHGLPALPGAALGYAAGPEPGAKIPAKKAGFPEHVATTPVPKMPFQPKKHVKKEVIETSPLSPSPPGRMGRLHKIFRELPQGVRLVSPSWASPARGMAHPSPTCSAPSQKAPTNRPQLEAALLQGLRGQLTEDGLTWMALGRPPFKWLGSPPLQVAGSPPVQAAQLLGHLMPTRSCWSLSSSSGASMTGASSTCRRCRSQSSPP